MEARLAQQAKQARQALKIHGWANESRLVCTGLSSAAYIRYVSEHYGVGAHSWLLPLYFEVSQNKYANLHLGISTPNACQSTIHLYMSFN